MESNADRKQNRVRYRMVILLAGTLQFIAGGVIMVHQVSSIRAISFVLGALVLLSGISHIFFSKANNLVLHGGQWHLYTGILDLIVGAVFVLEPRSNIAMVPVLVACWFLVRSVSLFVLSVTIRRLSVTGWGVLLTGGMLLLLLTAFILFNATIGSATVMLWIAFALIVTGIVNVWLALWLKGKMDDVITAFS
jgi:uncharacterized membrane protein HdeD (DUF308 family)